MTEETTYIDIEFLGFCDFSFVPTSTTDKLLNIGNKPIFLDHNYIHSFFKRINVPDSLEAFWPRLRQTNIRNSDPKK